MFRSFQQNTVFLKKKINEHKSISFVVDYESLRRNDKKDEK